MNAVPAGAGKSIRFAAGAELDYADGQATPATYLGADGRQYLVVVAGGHGSTGTKAGDSVIAYAVAGEAETR